MVLTLILAMSIVIMSVSSYVSTTSRMQKLSESEIRATRAAEAALEENMARLTNLARLIQPRKPSLADVTNLTNLSNAPTALFPASEGYTFRTNITVPVENGVAVAAHGPASDTNLTYRYLSAVEVLHQSSGLPSSRVALQREFIYRVDFVFQYAIFFEPVLELNPGAAFEVEGRVHANFDGAAPDNSFYYSSAAGLTFRGHITSVKGAVNAPNPADPRRSFNGSNITIANGPPVQPPFPVTKVGIPCRTVSVNPNEEGPIELIQKPAAGPDPNSDTRLFNKAGIKILVNSSPDRPATNVFVNGPALVNIPVRTYASGAALPAIGAPNDVLNNWPGFVLLTKDNTVIPPKKPDNSAFTPLYVLFNTILTFGRSGIDAPIIRDFRQGGVVGGGSGTAAMDRTVTQVDIASLTAAVDNPGAPIRIGENLPIIPDYGALGAKYLWNGAIYIHDCSFETNVPRLGVQLINGQSIPRTIVNGNFFNAGGAPSGGLTIVTDHPLYITGNYNTGGNPPYNTGGTNIADRAVPGYAVRPAAVMADSVTILSQNWPLNGSYNTQPLSGRTTVNTTVNTAILSGNVPSGVAGRYSGGAENFLRLLEDWNRRRLSYVGSMVCLFRSVQSPTQWNNTGTYYNAPNRNWHFEPLFRDPNSLPPITPSVVAFSVGQWAKLQ
jgi:Tfp pilus assembly protein PilX